MPVYEFYCSDCHTIFSFLSQRVAPEKRPSCPRCGKPELERQVSRFSVSHGQQEGFADEMPGIDDERMERAMETLAGQMEGIDENDPRQMAGFMRQLSEATGMDLGSAMEEAIRRLEAGEDPDRVEEEMGELVGGDNLRAAAQGKGSRKRARPPAVDDTLYRL
jgi:putative FmdB family regulatory protein